MSSGNRIEETEAVEGNYKSGFNFHCDYPFFVFLKLF